MITIKKYSNRRLYDTSTSEYITLEELAARIRDGHDVEVVNASSGKDITQRVLAQIILESRGAARMLPVPLLMRLIRMGDDRLTEFFGQFMSWSLELYLQFKEGAESMYGPVTKLSGPAGKWLQAMFDRSPGEGPSDFEPPVSPENTSEPTDSAVSTDDEPAPPGTSTEVERPNDADADQGESLQQMRREIDELKDLIQEMAGGRSTDADASDSDDDQPDQS
jgi:polyhydroxyalkanoate synthesis repressor PhaR